MKRNHGADLDEVPDSVEQDVVVAGDVAGPPSSCLDCECPHGDLCGMDIEVCRQMSDAPRISLAGLSVRRADCRHESFFKVESAD